MLSPATVTVEIKLIEADGIPVPVFDFANVFASWEHG